MHLAGYNPTAFKRFKWMFSWDQILKFYKHKQKDYADKFNTGVEIFIEIVSAALGGKKNDEEYGLADGSEIELSEEQIAKLKKSLGSNFAQIYP